MANYASSTNQNVAPGNTVPVGNTTAGVPSHSNLQDNTAPLRGDNNAVGQTDIGGNYANTANVPTTGGQGNSNFQDNNVPLRNDNNVVGQDNIRGNYTNTANLPNNAVPGGSYVSGGTRPEDVHASTGASIGGKVKGMAAQGHGMGETLRGNVNAAVDVLFGDTAGQAKNEEVARKGQREMVGKNFEHIPGRGM